MSRKPITVIKIGGAPVADTKRLRPFWNGLHQLIRETPAVIVHGGGPQATKLARQLGHEPRIVQGRRVTGDLDLQIMQWTLRGELNTNLVAQAARYGIEAVGISGADAGTVRVTKRPPWLVEGEAVDFGHVGDIERVRPNLLHRLLDGGFLPILAPLGIDAEGHLYNVNADTVACAVAAALGAEQFLLVTGSGGVRRDKDDPATRLASVTPQTIAAGVRDGWIVDGMLVKLNVALDAVRAGVPNVHILAPDDILSRNQGTQVVSEFKS